MELLKEHKDYKGMYYYRLRSKRWSKDFYNLSRANCYANEEANIELKPIEVGRLPYESKTSPRR